jgi:CCR4-NOT transcription complex subunit 9
MADFTALVRGLTNPELREKALLELSKKREAFQDLAPILWHSVGTISALLQEIVTIYPLLSPPDLTAPASNRVCNALALLQCVASHPETRTLFLNAHIPLYLYPFLNTVNTSRPFEYLRLTSLGVIGALVKMDDSDVINFLLQTEIIPLCLRIMETGTELSKTVATFIVQKILMDDMGLQYICQTAERFYAVSQVLSNMVGIEARKAIEAGAEQTTRPSGRLIKHIVRCYLRVCDNARSAHKTLERASLLRLSALAAGRTLPETGQKLARNWPDAGQKLTRNLLETHRKLTRH